MIVNESDEIERVLIWASHFFDFSDTVGYVRNSSKKFEVLLPSDKVSDWVRSVLI